MAKTPKHFPSEADEKLHKQINGTEEGGACLTGHSTRYDDACSCTYRWQAVRESRRARQGVYDKNPTVTQEKANEYLEKNPRVTSGFLPTSQYTTKRKSRFPSPTQYSDRIKLPEEGDWYVSGPLRSNATDAVGKGIPQGKNFTTWTWPYWNNAHHLIPKGTLNTVINEIAEDDCRQLVREGLLHAEYNVNHHINVILLPMDTEVARVLDLPRHLVLEDDSIVKEKGSKLNHREYNQNVRTRLDSIIDSYKATCDRERQTNCDPWPVIKLSKKRLEVLSQHCYAKVTQFGNENPGEAISALPPLLRPKS
ncbi:MAG TPA: AHH domain-containing protein [Archangium sp.]|uniref:AHH domain-containing protein n=1 Tax=Archangium sp. TaxID=1872627 RepID=UPI002E32C10C|nr:AHH domain-containing protein [Archangium sp.]HEX5748011.1 AHH domain-containing protein [Archangium sp.]